MKLTKRAIALILCCAMLLGLMGSAPQTLLQQVQAAWEEKSEKTEAPEMEVGPDAQGNYTLTLVLGSGQDNVVKKYRQGTELALEELPVPLMSGCEFTGWYLDKYLLEPCPDPYVVEGSASLYASFRADGTSFSAYQNNMPWDVEFVLRSSERITEETLKNYIEFEDIYNGILTISLEEISAQPDPIQPGREKGSQEKPSEKADGPILPPPELGEFRYRLYAEHGFGAGQLYGFTVLQPEKVSFLSAGNVSLENNQATQFNFQIKEEIFNTQKRKANVKELPAGSLVNLKDLGNFLYEGTFTGPRTPGEVVITENPDGRKMNYKILEEVGKNTYKMTFADSDDLWEEFALTSTTDTLSNVTFDMNPENVDATIRQIETNIGVAAYMDAALDSIRNNPEVIDFMSQVPQEEYDAFMNLRAVDLGYGPVELRDDPTITFNKTFPKAGTITGVIEDRPDGMSSYVKLQYQSPVLTIHMGKSATGAKGEVHLSLLISEEVEITAKGLTIKKNTYPSQDEDYVQTHILPECTTTIQFNADMELTNLHTYGNKGDGTSGTPTGTSGTPAGNSGTPTGSSGTPTGNESGSSSGTPTRQESGSNSGTPTRQESGSNSGTPIRQESGSTSGTPVRQESGSHSGTPVRQESGSHSGTPVRQESGSHSGTPVRQESGSHSGTPVRQESGSTSGTPARQESGGSGTGTALPNGSGTATSGTSTEAESGTSVEVEAPWEVDPYGDSITKKLNLAMANHDIYLYLEAMEQELVNNNEYYELDLSYTPLIEQEIGRLDFSVTGIENISIGLTFKIELAAKAQFTGTFKYTFLADVFTTNGRLIYENNKLSDIYIYDKDSKVDGSRILRSNLNINLNLKGGIGAQAGFVLDVSFSGFRLNSLLSVGMEATVGVYLELVGYIAYEYDRTTNYIYDHFADIHAEASGKQVSESSHFEGGLKIEAGIYVDVSATITFIWEWKASFLSFRFPLYQKQLGAFSTEDDEAIYGGFINSREEFTLQAGEGSSYEIALTDLKGQKADKIERSCKSRDLKPVEQKGSYGTGLDIYVGFLSSPPHVMLSSLPPDFGCTYRIISLKLEQGIAPAYRNFDGSTHFMDLTLTDTGDIEKYVTVTSDGRLKIKDSTQSMTLEILAEDPQLTNIFTQKPPQKVFELHFVGKNAGESYKMNFYDTDGNLLFTDIYPGGCAPLPLPGPGYTCREGKNQRYSVNFDQVPPKLTEEDIAFFKKNNVPLPDLGDGFTKEDARRYVYLDILQDAWEADWTYTAHKCWGYQPWEWDLDSAYWTDVNGKALTAETLPMQGTTDLYLRMKPAYEPQLVWMLDFRDPDRPYYGGGSAVYKSVPYEVGKLKKTAENTKDPVLNNHREYRDSQHFGTLQTFSRWSDRRNQLPQEEKTVRIYNHTPSESIQGTVFTYELKTSIREVSRNVPRRQVVAARSDAAVTYLWENVYFEKDGKTIAVRTDIGNRPAVPGAFDTADVMGWKNSYDGVVYQTPGVVSQRPWHHNHPSRVPIVYTPVENTRTILFDASQVGTLVWPAADQEEGIWYPLSDGGSWSYELLEDGNAAIHYSSGQNNVGHYTKNAFPPSLQVADPEFVLPVDEGNGVYRWISKEKAGEEPLILRDKGESVDFSKITWPESGVLTMEPSFESRTVIFTIPGTQKKFGGQEDMGFKLSGKLGETVPMEDVRAILKGILTPIKTYGPFQEADKITRIQMPKPYVYGAGDQNGKQTLVDRVELQAGWEDTLTLNLNGGSLTDGSKGVIEKQGNSIDTFELSTLSVSPTMKKTLEDDVYELCSFAGWQNADGKTVTSAHYGETLTAQWTPTGEKYFDLLLNLTAPLVFADGTASKSIAFDIRRTLKEQTGYEVPQDVTQGYSVYGFSKWMLNGSPISETASAKDFAGKPKTLTAALSIRGDVFDLTSWEGNYDGNAHTVTISNPKPGVTFLYSEDGLRYTAEKPQYTDAGTYTVYVKALLNGEDAHDIKTAQVVIRPLSGIKVTITGHTAQKVYNGEAQTVKGYDFLSDNPLLTEADVTFNGKAQARGTNAGKKVMGLKPDQFTVESSNFTNTVFTVTDGSLEITRKPVTVTAQDAPVGTDLKDLTALVTGTIKGDQVSYKLSLGEEAANGSREILCTGKAVQGNYQVTFRNGTLYSDIVIVTVVAPQGYVFDVNEDMLEGSAHIYETSYQERVQRGTGLSRLCPLYEPVSSEGYQWHSYVETNVQAYHVNGQKYSWDQIGDITFTQDTTVNVTVEDLYVDTNRFQEAEYAPGVSHSIEATASAGATLQYSLDQAAWTDQAPTFTEAGEQIGVSSWGPVYESNLIYVRAVNPSGDCSGIYTVELTILPKTLRVDIPGGLEAQKVYGEPDPVYRMDVDLDGTPTPIEFSIQREAGEDVREKAYWGNDSDGLILKPNRNYLIEVNNVMNWRLSILPRAITITPRDAEKTEGEADPEFPVDIENTDAGLTKTAAQVVKPGELSYTVERDQGEAPNTYYMWAEGQSEQGNYRVTYGSAHLTIRPKAAVNGLKASGSGTPLNPSSGTPIAPGSGTPLNPSSGTPIAPGSGTPLNPGSGTPIAPDTGIPPASGTPVVESGKPAASGSGTPITESGKPAASGSGTPITESGKPAASGSGTPITESGKPAASGSGTPIVESGKPAASGSGTPAVQSQTAASDAALKSDAVKSHSEKKTEAGAKKAPAVQDQQGQKKSGPELTPAGELEASGKSENLNETGEASSGSESTQ